MTYEERVKRIAYLGAQIRDLIREVPGASAVHISTTGKVSVKLEQPGILLNHTPQQRNMPGIGPEASAVIAGVELYWFGTLPEVVAAEGA